MSSLVGEYECKLDSKSRFLLPSGLRKQLDPEAEERFMLNRGFEGCLVLYPMNEWEKLTEKLKQLNLFKAKNRMFFRQFQKGAQPLELDGSGRLLIPTKMKKQADIGKTIVLFAYADRIEVWAKEKYEKYMEETKDEFEQLAEEVMGQDNNENEK
ncbi:MAG: division/cell wall cluster transcriptional repressor MraZ [Flavobacteriales bacterium]